MVVHLEGTPVHVVVMGCGRVGSTIAHLLEDSGHSVAVIDQLETAFRRLGPDFAGRTVAGVGFDREVLRRAGIEQAAAFAAVSSGDNSNILAARVARETFGIENVVARIYDPKRAEVYQRLGIPTVATVRWTADQMVRRLFPDGVQVLWRDPFGVVDLVEVHVHHDWYGQRVAEVQKAAGARVAFLGRLGSNILPTADTIIQEGDLVHVLLREAEADRVSAVLATPPVEK